MREVKFSEYEFKHALGILQQIAPEIPEIVDEVRNVLTQFQSPLGRRVTPTPAQQLEQAFVQVGWQSQHAVHSQKGLKFDLYKPPVAMEIQLTDASDVYNDFLKFYLAYNLELIEVGIEIVYDDSCRGKKFSNVPKISKVRKELETFRRIIPCPIWVIGLKP